VRINFEKKWLKYSTLLAYFFQFKCYYVHINLFNGLGYILGDFVSKPVRSPWLHPLLPLTHPPLQESVSFQEKNLHAMPTLYQGDTLLYIRATIYITYVKNTQKEVQATFCPIYYKAFCVKK
jgi:hypothetical protein